MYKRLIDFIEKYKLIYQYQFGFRKNHSSSMALAILLETWWRHQMETVSALLAICAGNSPVPGEFPHKGQWRGALMFSLIWARINGWVNNPEAGDLRRHPTHCDVIVMNITTALDHY